MLPLVLTHTRGQTEPHQVASETPKSDSEIEVTNLDTSQDTSHELYVIEFCTVRLKKQVLSYIEMTITLGRNR